MEFIECAKDHHTTKMIKISNKNDIFQCPTCFRKISFNRNKENEIIDIHEISSKEITDIKDLNSEMLKNTQFILLKRFKHLFYRFTHLTPLNYIIFSIIIGQILYAIHFFLAFLYKEETKLFSDFNWLTTIFITIGLIGVSYITKDWIMFYSKYHKKTEGEISETQKRYINYIKHIYNSKFYIPFSLFCSFIFILAMILFGSEYYSNFYVNLYGFYILAVIASFIAGNIVYLIFSGLYVFYKLSKDKIIINIYSLDKCGGLKIFGLHSLKQSIFLIIMLSISGGVVFFNPMVKASLIISIFYIGAAILGLIIVFLIPLYSIHKQIIDFKENEVDEVQMKIQELTNSTELKSEFLKKIYIDPIKKEELSELVNILNLISKIQNWPFDFKIIWQLIAALIIPILLVVLEKIIH